MKVFFFPLFILISFSSFCQDTIYLNNEWKETLIPAKASYYKFISLDPENSDKAIEKTFFISGKIYNQLPFLSYEEGIIHGSYKTWYENGNLRAERNYQNGKLDGLVLTYWKNGQMKRKDNYQKGELVEGTCWNVEGAEVEYYPLEVKPKFPGGKKGLVKYLKYNMKKSKNGETGKVLVKFKINKKGEVEDIVLEKKAALHLNLEAFRLVNEMPRWEPGLQDGEPVNVIYRLPITFR